MSHLTPARGIPTGGVAHRSFMPNELAVHALPAARRELGKSSRFEGTRSAKKTSSLPPILLDRFFACTRCLSPAAVSAVRQTRWAAVPSTIVTRPTHAPGPQHSCQSSARVALQKLRCYTGCMRTAEPFPIHLSDDALLNEVARLSADERAATARLIAALAEVDARRVYLGQGCASLFVYCTRVLHLSEHAAYGRIEAARAARRFPILLDRLEAGEITLTTLALLAPHLTDANHSEVIDRARFRSKREVEEIVASLRPRPDVPTQVRKLAQAVSVPVASLPTPIATSVATPTVARTVASPAPRVVMEPLAPERYKLQVTMSRSTRDKLRRAQDLMRHVVPSGDVAAILDRALDLLLTDLERRKLAQVTRPRNCRTAAARSRHVPAHVRREVWRRAEGRCAFSGPQGRCAERSLLEFHHVRPFEAGGDATVDNIALRCRAHNQYEAHLFIGEPYRVVEGRPYSELGPDRVV